MRAIYVVVDVSYDYYRFQQNLGAFTGFDAANKFAEQRAALSKLTVLYTDAESKAMDHSEASHIWIEKFENETTP